MSEPAAELPNFRTEGWREEQLSIFTHHFEEATSEIAQILGEEGQPENKIVEWYDPSIERAYFIHGSTQIGLSLRIFEVTWGILTEELDRYNILIAPDLTGQGYGTRINQVMEKLGRELGVKRLTLSAITNDRWKRKLLRDGFIQNPNQPDKVYKNL